MDDRREKILNYLDNLKINYRMVEHPAVYTIEEMERLEMEMIGGVIKNLFLKDATGKRHFLVMLRQDKKVDLKSLPARIGSAALSFASAERLNRFLGLEKGAVSPLGLLNDQDKVVEVVFDRDLLNFEFLGVHPNENTATLWLTPADLQKIINLNGNAIIYVDL